MSTPPTMVAVPIPDVVRATPLPGDPVALGLPFDTMRHYSHVLQSFVKTCKNAWQLGTPVSEHDPQRKLKPEGEAEILKAVIDLHIVLLPFKDETTHCSVCVKDMINLLEEQALAGYELSSNVLAWIEDAVTSGILKLREESVRAVLKNTSEPLIVEVANLHAEELKTWGGVGKRARTDGE